jgi:acyl-[acyl-carrier-protein] desaturase
MVLADWLLKSKHRTDEQMADLEGRVFATEWDLPYDNARAMVCYTTLQELATWLSYKNMRDSVGENGDPALYRVLSLVAIDERAHYDFFKRLVQLYLEYDRQGTLEQLSRVVNTFAMPAVHLLTDGRQRSAAVKSLRIFDDEIFFHQVLTPTLSALGVSLAELRRRKKREIIQPLGVSH